MKYTTKDGEVLEGTAEEIFFFKQLHTKSPQEAEPVKAAEPEPVTVSEQPRKKSKLWKHNKQWDKDELKELKEVYPYWPMSKLISHFGRTKSSIAAKAWEMGVNRFGRKSNKPRQPAVIRRVAKALGEGQTQRQAERTALNTPERSFPKFSTVDDMHQDLLHDMVANVIAQNGSMRFGADGVALGIDGVRGWRDFLYEFMRLSPQIAAYFSVKNGFQCDNAMTVRYQ